MKKDTMKMTLLSVLAIVMIGNVFVGINHLTLLSASHHTESIKLLTTEVGSERFQEQEQTIFNLTVFETSLKDEHPIKDLADMGYSFDKPENLISKEEAAQIGAQYIYDMLGENIEGKIISMNYFERHSRPYWQGTVGNSEEDLKNRKRDFTFLIDAVTGERMSIDNHVDLDRSENALENLIWDNPTYLSADQVAEYTKLVNHFAEIQFTNSTVTRIDFIGIDWLGATKDESGKFDLEWIARFNVLDDMGRTASVAITVESQQLRHFSVSDSYTTHIENDKKNQALMDEDSPTVEWELASGETILIVDNTELSKKASPYLNFELTPYNLSIEEAAEIGAQLIYEEFGESVEGMRFEKIFWHFALGDRELWNGVVYNNEGQQVFYYLIDARTGERMELSRNTDENPFRG